MERYYQANATINLYAIVCVPSPSIPPNNTFKPCQNLANYVLNICLISLFCQYEQGHKVF